MSNRQQGILEPIPHHAKYLLFDQIPGAEAVASLRRLAGYADGVKTVVGLRHRQQNIRFIYKTDNVTVLNNREL